MEVTFEDQKRINTFSKLTSVLNDLEAKAGEHKRKLQTLEDAEGDIMMLDDEDSRVPYRIGEVFMHLSQEEAQERLEQDKEKVRIGVTGRFPLG